MNCGFSCTAVTGMTWCAREPGQGVRTPMQRVGGRPPLGGDRGEGVRGPKKICAPKIDLRFRDPLMNFILFLRKNFLMSVGRWVGGWVGQAEEPRLPFRPPSPVTVSRGLVAGCTGCVACKLVCDRVFVVVFFFF